MSASGEWVFLVVWASPPFFFFDLGPARARGRSFLPPPPPSMYGRRPVNPPFLGGRVSLCVCGG